MNEWMEKKLYMNFWGEKMIYIHKWTKWIIKQLTISLIHYINTEEKRNKQKIFHKNDLT